MSLLRGGRGASISDRFIGVLGGRLWGGAVVSRVVLLSISLTSRAAGSPRPSKDARVGRRKTQYFQFFRRSHRSHSSLARDTQDQEHGERGSRCQGARTGCPSELMTLSKSLRDSAGRGAPRTKHRGSDVIGEAGGGRSAQRVRTPARPRALAPPNIVAAHTQGARQQVARPYSRSHEQSYMFSGLAMFAMRPRAPGSYSITVVRWYFRGQERIRRPCPNDESMRRLNRTFMQEFLVNGALCVGLQTSRREMRGCYRPLNNDETKFT